MEIVFRVLPVSNGLGREVMPRFEPITGGTPGRPFIFARDWKFTQSNRSVVNSDGFYNVSDYPGEGAEQVVAIIGDSFVEAVMIPPEGSLQSVVSDRLKAGGAPREVVGLGMSSADSGTMLHFFQRATELWKLDSAVIVVGERDLSQALNKKRGLAQFVVDGDDVSLEMPSPWRGYGRVGQLARKIMVPRYIFGQLRLTPNRVKEVLRDVEFSRPWFSNRNGPVASGTGASPTTPDQRAALAFFVSEVARLKQSEGCRVVFAINGTFEDPFALDPDYPYGPLTELLVEQAAGEGIEVVDIYPSLHRLSVEQGVRPRWLDDGHWTVGGYRVVAEEIARQLLSTE